ncbi:IclR family transcriptional regulator C-terminal domain-containing protein [Halostagnicola sp. A-GB9-2]|nr:IclR family transcriptional regulator C-terminal domain-containing protein [Halostagnicola sp. A-GB9-2]MDJ1433676.1 IclR family transcriptional regulator C-terminal domain-containing protein [Halostagnicola sp. A-GB9-2]
MYVQKATGNDALQPYASIGTRCDLHSIAGGKAILAALPDDNVDKIVEEHGLEQRTDHTITSASEKKKSLNTSQPKPGKTFPATTRPTDATVIRPKR